MSEASQRFLAAAGCRLMARAGRMAGRAVELRAGRRFG